MRQRRSEQGASHALWPEARDDCADDPHRERQKIHHGRRIDVISGLDKVPTEKEEPRRQRNADCGSVRDCVNVPGYQFIRKANAED